MNLGWQDVMALGIVLAAAGYLVRLAWTAMTRKSESGCGEGCGKCSMGSTASRASVEPVVTIGNLRQSSSIK